MTGDERRSFYRRGLNNFYLPYYDGLCGILGEDWQPFQGLRTIKEQDALYAKGRTVEPLGHAHRVTDAPGGASGHNYGCATDWTKFVEGKPLWLTIDAPEWREYENACEKAGVHWLGVTTKGLADYYHNEVRLKVSWTQVKQVLDTAGYGRAIDFIGQNLG